MSELDMDGRPSINLPNGRKAPGNDPDFSLIRMLDGHKTYVHEDEYHTSEELANEYEG